MPAPASRVRPAWLALPTRPAPPPVDGFCSLESLDAGYVGGACSADCSSIFYEDRWCGVGGQCTPQFVGRDSLSAPVIGWICERGCGPTVDGGPGATCRTGYVCEGTARFSTCIPRCTNSGAGACTSPKVCNAGTGLCQ